MTFLISRISQNDIKHFLLKYDELVLVLLLEHTI